MSDKDRLPLFPSRANEVYMKQRIVMANKGLTLLKRKRDAIELKIREVNLELKSYTELVDQHMTEALFAISKAKYLCTDFKPAQVMKTDCSDVYMILDYDKVAGLKLPKFDLIMNRPTCFPYTGLSHGGVQVSYIRIKFRDAIKAIVSRASLEFTLSILQNGLKLNNMRLNGLDFVVIPRFVNTMHYIHDELDEFEREEFYRLKQSKAKQQKRRENFTKVLHIKKGDFKDKDDSNKSRSKALWQRLSDDSTSDSKPSKFPPQNKQVQFNSSNEPPKTQSGRDSVDLSQKETALEKSSLNNASMEKVSRGKWLLNYSDVSSIQNDINYDKNVSQLQYVTETHDAISFFEIDSDDELLSVGKHTFKRLSEKEVDLIRENYRKSSGPYVRDSRMHSSLIIPQQYTNLNTNNTTTSYGNEQPRELTEFKIEPINLIKNSEEKLHYRKADNQTSSNGGSENQQETYQTRPYEGAPHMMIDLNINNNMEQKPNEQLNKFNSTSTSRSNQIGLKPSKTSIRFQIEEENSINNESQQNMDKSK